MIKTDALESIFIRLGYAQAIQAIKNGLKRMFTEIGMQFIPFVILALYVLPYLRGEKWKKLLTKKKESHLSRLRNLYFK